MKKPIYDLQITTRGTVRPRYNGFLKNCHELPNSVIRYPIYHGTTNDIDPRYIQYIEKLRRYQTDNPRPVRS